MPTRGHEPAATWRASAAAVPRMDRPDGPGRRPEDVPIGGDFTRPERVAADGRGFDERPGVSLRDLTRGTVRAALRARRGIEKEQVVLQLLCLTCGIARANGTQVEQVLILLKEAWREQPEARPRHHSDAEDTLAQLITLCIEEYYAPRRLTS